MVMQEADREHEGAEERIHPIVLPGDHPVISQESPKLFSPAQLTVPNSTAHSTVYPVLGVETYLLFSSSRYT